MNNKNQFMNFNHKTNNLASSLRNINLPVVLNTIPYAVHTNLSLGLVCRKGRVAVTQPVSVVGDTRDTYCETTEPPAHLPGRCRKPGRTLGQLYLISHIALGAERRVALAVVDPRLHYPLVVEGREPTCLIEQFVHKLVRSVRLQLQICKHNTQL